MQGSETPYKGAFKAKWHGKNKFDDKNGASKPLLRPADRLLIRLRSCADLLARTPDLEDDLCTSLLHQAAVYASFMNDVLRLRVNVLDNEVVKTIRSVGDFCVMIEDEYSCQIASGVPA